MSKNALFRLVAHVFLYFNIWKHNLTRTLSRSSLQKQQLNNAWIDFYAKWLRCRLEVVSSNLTEVKTLSVLSYFPFYKDLLVFRRIYIVSDNFSFSLLQQQSDFSRGGWSSAMVAIFFPLSLTRDYRRNFSWNERQQPSVLLLETNRPLPPTYF